MTAWYCHKCAKTIPADEIYLLTWDSPHGDERHIPCGGDHLDLVDEPADEEQP